MGKGIYALVAIIRTEGQVNRMSDDLISRKFLLECAEYDNNGRLIIPYRYVKNAPIAFDKEKVVKKLKEEGCIVDDEAGNRAVEIVEKGGID